MIEKARNRWLADPACPALPLLDYMQQTGKLRDAQLDAIKTYLFLKIAGNNAPLHELFTAGVFNQLSKEELEQLSIPNTSRQYFLSHPAAQALFEYALTMQENNSNPTFYQRVSENPESIDAPTFWSKTFYGITYADYLFSLPMGAGKTYLMAAFIYLDLYYAQNEPDNPAFAHNFLICAPSGTKSSVIPSLKTIQNFDSAWVLPEPAATTLKRQLKFELLDEDKSSAKSNRAKNPNVQKINSHQPLPELFGLVAVVNAEKVILNRVKLNNTQTALVFEETDDEKDRRENELRNILGKIPRLAVMVDEVHHATSEDIKLRAVINKWMEERELVGMLGFSGTPYLDKKEKIALETIALEITASDSTTQKTTTPETSSAKSNLAVAMTEIANTVYYYPLAHGIDNFLKQPTVKVFSNATSEEIVSESVADFLETYQQQTYANGLLPKLAIYCGNIERLEESIYPLVETFTTAHGLNASEVILKYHNGNKTYPAPRDAKTQFDSLDIVRADGTALSQVRVILLVQIGKEGWDCKSLAGVVLSQEKDTPRNMVLQTSCRCLREVTPEAVDTARIYLNAANAHVLDTQLKKQQHIGIEEFQQKQTQALHTLKRYDRREALVLPSLTFNQLNISFEECVHEEGHSPALALAAIDAERQAKRERRLVQTREGLSASNARTQALEDQTLNSLPVTFLEWLQLIAKESFATLGIKQLLHHHKILQTLFQQITETKPDTTADKAHQRFYRPSYRQAEVRALIRRAFCPRRELKTREELIPQTADLLVIEGHDFNEFQTEHPERYIPTQEIVADIVATDEDGQRNGAQEELIAMLKKMGRDEEARKEEERAQAPNKASISYHYLPYGMDSQTERDYFATTLEVLLGGKYGVEIYYNGDRFLTDFRIKCFSGTKGKRRYLGQYTPDFLLVQRKDKDTIAKVLIVETKGQGYGEQQDFVLRKQFMETVFKEHNTNYHYLYIEDSQSVSAMQAKTMDAVESFFRED